MVMGNLTIFVDQKRNTIQNIYAESVYDQNQNIYRYNEGPGFIILQNMLTGKCLLKKF